MKKPRKKKIQPIRKLWEIDDGELNAVIAHLQIAYPTSQQLETFEKEMARRKAGLPIPEVKDE